MPLTFSANVSTMFREHQNFLDRFAEAKERGFKFYDMKSPYNYAPEGIKNAADGMVCVLMDSVAGDTGYGMASNPKQKYDFSKGADDIIHYYNALGVKKLHILAGLKDPEVSQDLAIDTFVDNLVSWDDYLDTFNMIGLIKPIPDVKENYFLDSFELALEILQRVNLGHFKLLLDVYDLQQITGDFKENLERYYPYAGHIQITKDPDRVESVGEIDINYVLNFLEEKNHKDPVGLAYFPSNCLSDELALGANDDQRKRRMLAAPDTQSPKRRQMDPK